jgi:aspartyl-tRNA synthetase
MRTSDPPGGVALQIPFDDSTERVETAFPSTTSVSRLATDASSPVDAQQLKEFHPHIQ